MSVGSTEQRTCEVCGWSGEVFIYDIGDGPEWACPGCDQCFPSNFVVGPDGLSNGERLMLEQMNTVMREHHPEWFEPGTKHVRMNMRTGEVTEETM